MPPYVPTPCHGFGNVDLSNAMQAVQSFIDVYKCYVEGLKRQHHKNMHVRPRLFQKQLQLAFGIPKDEMVYCRRFKNQKGTSGCTTGCILHQELWNKAFLKGFESRFCRKEGGHNHYDLGPVGDVYRRSVNVTNMPWWQNKRFTAMLQKHNFLVGFVLGHPSSNDAENHDTNICTENHDTLQNSSSGMLAHPNCELSTFDSVAETETASNTFGSDSEDGGLAAHTADDVISGAQHIGTVSRGASAKVRRIRIKDVFSEEYLVVHADTLLEIANGRAGICEYQCAQCMAVGSQCVLGNRSGLNTTLTYKCIECHASSKLPNNKFNTSPVTGKLPVPWGDVGDIPVTISNDLNRTNQHLSNWFEYKPGNYKQRHINVVFGAALHGSGTGYARAKKMFNEMGVAVPEKKAVAKVTDLLHLAAMVESQSSFAAARYQTSLADIDDPDVLVLKLKAKYQKEYKVKSKFVRVPVFQSLCCDGYNSHGNHSTSSCQATAIVVGTPGEAEKWLVVDEMVQQSSCSGCSAEDGDEHKDKTCYKNSSISPADVETDSLYRMGRLSIHPNRIRPNEDTVFFSYNFAMDGDSRGPDAWYRGVFESMKEFYDVSEIEIAQIIEASKVCPDKNHVLKILKTSLLSMNILQSELVDRLLSYVSKETDKLRKDLLKTYKEQKFRRARVVYTRAEVQNRIHVCQQNMKVMVQHLAEDHSDCNNTCTSVRAEIQEVETAKSRESNAALSDLITIETNTNAELARSTLANQSLEPSKHVNFIETQHSKHLNDHNLQRQDHIDLASVSGEVSQDLSAPVQQCANALNSATVSELQHKLVSVLDTATLFYMSIGLRTSSVQSLWQHWTAVTSGRKRQNACQKGNWRGFTLLSAMRTNEGTESVMRTFDDLLQLKRATVTTDARKARDKGRELRASCSQTDDNRQQSSNAAAVKKQRKISMTKQGRTNKTALKRIENHSVSDSPPTISPIDTTTQRTNQESDEGFTVNGAPVCEDDADRKTVCKKCGFTHSKSEVQYCFIGSSTENGKNPFIYKGPMVSTTGPNKKKRKTAPTTGTSSISEKEVCAMMSDYFWQHCRSFKKVT